MQKAFGIPMFVFPAVACTAALLAFAVHPNQFALLAGASVLALDAGLRFFKRSNP